MSLFLRQARAINLRYFSNCKNFLQRVYTNEEKELILNKINSLDLHSKGVSDSNVSKISLHVKKQKIETLEDLLFINGIGPKILRRLCDTILNSNDDPPESLPVIKKKSPNLVVPPIEEFQEEDLINISAIHVGIQYISWALLNSSNNCLIKWDFIEHTQRGDLNNCLHLVDEVSSHIPIGDLYLIEESGFSRNHIDSYKNLISAMLSTIIHCRHKERIFPVVAFVKPSVKNKVYNGLVGSERVSLQNHVIDMIHERSKIDCISFPEELKSKYLSLGQIEREEMGQSLLLATSFVNLVLNQRKQKL